MTKYVQSEWIDSKNIFSLHSRRNILPTSVNSVVRIQLVFQTELLGTMLALVGFFPSVFLSMGLWFMLWNGSSSTEQTPCTSLTCANKQDVENRGGCEIAVGRGGPTTQKNIIFYNLNIPQFKSCHNQKNIETPCVGSLFSAGFSLTLYYIFLVFLLSYLIPYRQTQ